MEQKINIAEILKDAPYKTKLYSTLCGDCYLLNIEENIDTFTHPILVAISKEETLPETIKFTKEGKSYNDGECLLFPSKDNRDWSTFKVPWKHKHFSPFQKVLYWMNNDLYQNYTYFADFYSHYDETHKEHVTTSGKRMDDISIIPFKGNEDKLGKKVKYEERTTN